MKNIRCDGCDKLLAIIKDNKIEIKCPRCHKINKEQIEALEARKQKVSRDAKIRIY